MPCHSTPEAQEATRSRPEGCICRCYSTPRIKAHNTLLLLGSLTKLEVGRDGAVEEPLSKSMNKDAKRALLIWLAAKALPWKPQGLKARVECNLCSAMWKKDLYEMWQKTDAAAQKQILERLEAETELEGTFSVLIDVDSENKVSTKNKDKESEVMGKMDGLWNKYFKQWEGEHLRME